MMWWPLGLSVSSVGFSHSKEGFLELGPLASILGLGVMCLDASDGIADVSMHVGVIVVVVFLVVVVVHVASHLSVSLLLLWPHNLQ